LLAAGVGGLMLGSASTSTQPVALTIVLDNSIASALRSPDGSTALDRSKATALRAIDDLDPARGDRAALITLAAPASAPVMLPTTDLDAIRALIDSTRSVDSAPDIPGMIDLLNAQDTPEESTTQTLAIASTFRGFDTRDFPSESRSARFARVLVQTPDTTSVNNLGIRSITPSRSLRLDDTSTALPLTVRLELARSGELGESTSIITLRDAASAGTLATGTHRWSSGETDASLILAAQPGALTPLRASASAIIATIDDTTNTRDNTSSTIVGLRRSLRVGVIHSFPQSDQQPSTSTIRASRALRAALSPNPSSPIELVLIDHDRLSTQRLNSLDALFVLTPDALDDQAWGMLAGANRAGLVLVFTPGAQAPAAGWIPNLETLGLQSPPAPIIPLPHDPAITLQETLPPGSLLEALSSEYPTLARSVQVSRSIDLRVFTQATPIVFGSENTPIAIQLRSSPSSSGAIIVLAFSLDFSWTDLPARPLFVPMMQELVRQSVGRSRVRPQLLAGHPSADAAELVFLKHASTDQPPADSSLRIAGLYASLDEDGAPRAIVAVNPDANAARTTPIPASVLNLHLTQMFQIDSIERIDPQNSIAPTGSDPIQPVSAGSLGFAGLLFLIAAAIGTLELILARVFSFRDQATRSGSSA
ncbi:MAG: hypothetical protein KC996_02945, partial [Phycisphaerales bacterium]|nr:hypothetical protein [Phycisphaerales bacterium]